MSPRKSPAIDSRDLLSVDRDAGAAARAEDSRKHDLMARPRAIHCFRHGKAIGVVHAAHGAPKRRAQILIQRIAV